MYSKADGRATQQRDFPLPVRRHAKHILSCQKCLQNVLLFIRGLTVAQLLNSKQHCCQILKLVVVSHFALCCSNLSQEIQSETEMCVIPDSIFCTTPNASYIEEQSILPGTVKYCSGAKVVAVVMI